MPTKTSSSVGDERENATSGGTRDWGAAAGEAGAANEERTENGLLLR